MRRGRARAGGEAGYLLVEALATLALAALLLGGLLALGGGLSRIAERMVARVEVREQGERAAAAVAREIGGLSRRRFAGGEDAGFVFLGRPDRIVFVTEALQADGLARPVAVAYQAVGGELLRAEGELPPAAASFDEVAFSRPHRIALGREELRFAYVERLKSGGEVITEDWPRSGLLPFAVRIQRVDPADGRMLAARRAPIWAETEPGCAAPEVAFCSTKKKPADAAGPRRTAPVTPERD